MTSKYEVVSVRGSWKYVCVSEDDELITIECDIIEEDQDQFICYGDDGIEFVIPEEPVAEVGDAFVLTDDWHIESWEE